MTIIEAVREYIKSYPPLSGGRLNVDFLPEEAQNYSVDVVPCKEWVKQYVDGSGVKQFLFVLSSREFYGEHIRQQIDNLEFYEKFQLWLEQQTKKRGLPQLEDGRMSQKIEVLTSGYVFMPGIETARYQIQCRLEYFQGSDYGVGSGDAVSNS